MLIAAACGGDGRTGPVDIAEIAIQPETVQLESPGQSQRLTVTARDPQGSSVDNPPLDWTSSDPDVVTVNSTGLLRAEGYGTAVVAAAFGEVSDTATVIVSGFDIELRYMTSLTPAQRAAFEAARNRWASIIVGDLPDVNDDVPPNQCGPNPATAGPFDDVLIFVAVDSVDGPSGILAQAGPCFIRVPGDLTVVGRMQFDEDDLEDIEADGQLDEVVLHEMGHVLGFGTLWNPQRFDLVRNPSPVPNPDPLTDTHFIGPQAIAAFNAAGGGTYAGAKVPVENEGDSGTVNSHWRDAVFDSELMTGFINTGANPLSAISVAAMEDISYTVLASGADPYTIDPTVAGVRVAGPRRGRQMVNDVISDPIRRIDLNGRIVGVIRR